MSRIFSVYKNRFGLTGDYSATMTSNGIQITGKKEVVKSQSKRARKRDLTAAILNLDPPNITKELIIEKFELTSSQAYLILKELQDSGKLVRYGRGNKAVFKKLITAS